MLIGKMLLCVYHVKSIKLGFSATGRKKWQAQLMATGQMATIVVMRQRGGTAIAPATRMPISRAQKTKVPLNFLRSLGISLKKVVFSTSLEVAPQLMSMENMWERIACETCREQPPKKMVSIRIHLKFSINAQKRLWVPRR